MSNRFDLTITAEADQPTAWLRLCNHTGTLLAERHTDFTAIRAGLRDGLFNLRGHVQRYAEAVAQAQAVAEVGVCIAEQVLGDAIMGHLWQPEHQRTLRIALPGATAQDQPLAAALARVPWEIARPAAGQPTLAERNLLVRVVHDMAQPSTQPLQLAPDEALRVLFVFAEARGSLPLGARAERLALLQLLQQSVYPQRRIEAHVLCHGVTRDRLEEQVRQHGGYHLLHWSGHGHLNLLELAGADGQPDQLSGQDVLDLFKQAGGFLPRLVFLSACHSGGLLRVRNWDDFAAVASGQLPQKGNVGALGNLGAAADAAPNKDGGNAGDSSALERKLDLSALPGFTGTAHALLQGGVPSVVAMRFAVGDDYARDLAVAFYRALLADARPKNAAEALTQARRALRKPSHPNAQRYAACDPATPLLYGAEQPGLALPAGPSPLLHPRNPCLHHIAELLPSAHPHFVGRSWELAALGADFIGVHSGAQTRPVALITGLGGMGKTALVAEVLALWQQRFHWVLLYQAKPNPLGLETVLHDMHGKLNAELGLYHQHVRANPADAVYRDAAPGFDGPDRLQRLSRNLLRALRSEPILLVLDNFETQLAAPNGPGPAGAEPGPGANVTGTDSSSADARCADPAWDQLLASLAAGLAGSPSRLLLTSRRALAVLPAALACRLPLGPLPAAEAAFFLRQHPVLSGWLFSPHAAEQARARRVLAASRFHPLLMDRLARLASQPLAGGLLDGALAALDGAAGHAALPALFAGQPGDATELAYLDEALVHSLDRLIAELGIDARQALWLVALTNQPEPGAVLQAVWAGDEDEQTQQLRKLQHLLDNLPSLPAEAQQQLRAMPAELRKMLGALAPPPKPQPPLAPLLTRLESLGLLNRAADTTTAAIADASGQEIVSTAALASSWICHELVRERIAAWVAARPAEAGDRPAAGVRSALAAQWQAVFKALQHQDMGSALAAGSRALVYAVQAGDFDRLAGFASSMLTSTHDPQLLQGLLPHLQAAADAAPPGPARWQCLTYLADGLRNSGRTDASLLFYDRAAALARAEAEAGGVSAKQAWSALAWISGNAAGAMGDTGDLDGSRRLHLESADAERRAGKPAIYVIGSELEALRIDVKQGRAREALPQIESRLAQVSQWWLSQRAGKSVADAPDAEDLARGYISALDVARQADFARKDWPSALRRLDATLDAKRALNRPADDVAGTRMNRANVLAKMPGRFSEAKAELETCLALFHNDPARSARTLGSLAILYDEQRDTAQALPLQRRALAMCEQLPSPNDRAISHGNLSNYLERLATAESLAEAPRHQMAGLVYFFVAGLGQHLQTAQGNYAVTLRRARATGVPPNIPQLDDLLADPAFDPLARWLRQRQVPLPQLQADIDAFLAQAQHIAEDNSRWTP